MNTSSLLKVTFIAGALIDAAIALSWFFIASGLAIPNILSGYQGIGADYQFAMYISAMFMLGWSVILAWGAFSPLERKGLLPITAVFLSLSIVIELSIYNEELSGAWFIFGVIKRSLLVLLFTYAFLKVDKDNTL